MLNLLFAAVLVAQAAQQPTVSPVGVTTQEAMRHRTSQRLFLRAAPEQRLGGSLPHIQVAVTVDAGGAVVAANAPRGQNALADYNPTIYADAESLVRALQYAPFERDGHPVAVRFSEYVALLPPELQPVMHVPFPKVKDLNSVKITLVRTACYGACPSYSVELHGDGTVLYKGAGHVAVLGEHRGSVSQASIAELLKLFEAADYYSLRDAYRLPVTDLPTYVTSIQIDGRVKRVEDYAGWGMGMPLAVSELEDAVDRLSGTERWITGSPNKDKD